MTLEIQVLESVWIMINTKFFLLYSETLLYWTHFGQLFCLEYKLSDIENTDKLTKFFRHDI